MTYQYQPPKARDYTELDGFFKPLDVANMEQLNAADYYPSLLINSAKYKSGITNGIKGTFEYEYLHMTAVDTRQQKKINLAINMRSNVGQELLNELVYLLDLKDRNGQPGFNFENVTYNGNTWTAEKNLPGKRIDAVLDGFNYENGYVHCKIVGFFREGRSCAEIASNIPPQNSNDLNRALASLTQVRGRPIEMPNAFGMYPANSNNVTVRPPMAQRQPMTPPPTATPPQQFAPLPPGQGIEPINPDIAQQAQQQYQHEQSQQQRLFPGWPQPPQGQPQQYPPMRTQPLPQQSTQDQQEEDIPF